MKKQDVGWFGIKPFASNSLFKGTSAPDSPHFEEDNRIARLALRYILCNPAITAPIPGLITLQQVDNAALAVAERRTLDVEEKAEFDRAVDRAWANLPSHYQWLKDWEYVYCTQRRLRGQALHGNQFFRIESGFRHGTPVGRRTCSGGFRAARSRHCTLLQRRLATLRKFKGRLVLVGKDDVLKADEYGHARSLDLTVARIPFNHGTTSYRELHAQILANLPAWNVHPAVELQGEKGQAVWGVEYRSVDTPDGPIVNLCNQLNVPVSVTLVRAGHRATAQTC